MGDSSNWIRSRRGVSCPICGYNNGKCLIGVNGDAVICFNVREGCARRADGTEISVKGGMGWTHRLSADQIQARKKEKRPSVGRKVEIASAIDWELLQRKLSTQVNPDRLSKFAESLGLTADGLRAFGVGYDLDTRSWSFPMYSGLRGRDGWAVCGIRMRSSTGAKFAVAGSRSGIFIPVDYQVAMGGEPSLIVVLPEGVTDAIMARECGFRSIGRPSCLAGFAECRSLLSQGEPQHVVIFADRDETKWLWDREGNPTEAHWPGWEGAVALSRAVHEYARTVRIMQPPKGIKDLRCWIQADRANVFTMQGGMISTPELTMEDIYELHESVERMRKVVKKPNERTK